jgi:LacI family transcriptional regulator
MTIRAIARELGLSATAVSLALRGSPRVSSGTRKRIAQLAKSRGYVPNARVSELMNEVRSSRTPGFHATLAAFSLFPTAEPWKEANYGHLREVFEGARECAERHGYKLELLWLRAPGMTPARFRTILETRGIRGLYCLGSLSPDEPLPAGLEEFSVVAHASSVGSRLHRVASHFAHDCRTLLDQLCARGYRRPGLVIKRSGDRRTDFAYTSTFSGYQERALPAPHAPIFRIEEWDEAAFIAWFMRSRPDVLVVHHEATLLHQVEATLAKHEVQTPKDLGLALLDKNPDKAVYSGIVQDNRLMGAEAIEMLIGRICLNDFGPPEQPKFELVEGYWNEGRTLRRPTKPEAAARTSSADRG